MEGEGAQGREWRRERGSRHVIKAHKMMKEKGKHTYLKAADLRLLFIRIASRLLLMTLPRGSSIFRKKQSETICTTA